MKDYTPYTKEEYSELKTTLETRVTQYLPDDLSDWAWNNKNKIENSNERKPCTCGSAGVHWKRAIDTIRNFINKVEGV